MSTDNLVDQLDRSLNMHRKQILYKKICIGCQKNCMKITCKIHDDVYLPTYTNEKTRAVKNALHIGTIKI